MSKEKETPILVQKADAAYRISAVQLDSLVGNKKKLTIQHKIGRNGALTIVNAMEKLDLRNQYLKKVSELQKKWKGDSEAYQMEDQMWKKTFHSQAKDALKRALDIWKDFYQVQDLEPCATWIPTGDKDKGSVFAIWAMVELSSRRLALGTDADYAKYIWQMKKSTESAKNKNLAITRDAHEYLKMGHAGKEVAHFLKQVVSGDIPGEPPPGIAYEPKK